MAIGIPYASAATWYGTENSTSETITCSVNVTEGDLIVVITYVSNEGTAAPFPDASIIDFTHIDQFEPPIANRGIVDVLAKYVTAGEDGTAPTYTVEFNYPSTFGKVMQVTVIPSADIAGITLDLATYSASSVTFPNDSQALTLHVLGNNANNVDQDTDFPAGDTGVTWPPSGSWRQAGFAVSGGATASGAFPTSVQGTFGTIHFNELAATGPVTAITNIAQNEVLDPATVLSIDVDITGPDTVDRLEVGLQRLSDSMWWNNGWQAGAFTYIDPISPVQSPPFTRVFGFAGQTPTLTEGVAYRLDTRARDTLTVTGPTAARLFTVGTYQYAPDITITALDLGGTTATIDTPPTASGGTGNSNISFVAARGSWRQVNWTYDSLDITGVASSSGSTIDFVEARINGGAWSTATNTGTNYSTWSHSFAGIVEGSDNLIEARAVDITPATGPIDTLQYESNGEPNVTSWSLPADSSVIPAGGSIAITATADDNTDSIVAARGITYWVVRLVDETPGPGSFRHWNGTTWTVGPTDTSFIFNQVFDTVGSPDTDTLTAETLPNLVLDELMTLRLTLWARDDDNRWGAAPAPNPRTFTTGATGGNTPPTITTLSQPTNPTYVPAAGAPIVITGLYADLDGAADVTLIEANIDGGTWFPLTHQLAGTFNGATPALTPGSYTLNIRATDDEPSTGPTFTFPFVVLENLGTVIDTDPLLPTLACPTAVDFYRVLFGDITSSVIYGELPFTQFDWSEVLNGAGVIAGTIPIDTTNPALTAVNLTPGRTQAWVIRDGIIVKGGIHFAKPSINLATNQATLSFQGHHAYLRHRHLLATLNFSNVDQLTIAETLVNYAAGQIGVTTDTLTSGRTRTRNYWWWEARNIGDAIEQLAAVNDGFDFRYRYQYGPSGPEAIFTTMYPNSGRATDLVFHIGQNCDLAGASEDGTQLGNTAITLGAGEGADTLISTLTDGAALAGSPIYETVQVHTDVTRTTTLDEHGGNRLKQTAYPVDRLTLITHRDVGPQLGEYQIGDRVRIIGSLGWWQVDAPYRIVAYNVTVQSGSETVTLDVAPLTAYVT